MSLIDFRYGIVGTKKEDIFSFINPNVKEENFDREFKAFNVSKISYILFLKVINYFIFFKSRIPPVEC